MRAGAAATALALSVFAFGCHRAPAAGGNAPGTTAKPAALVEEAKQTVGRLVTAARERLGLEAVAAPPEEQEKVPAAPVVRRRAVLRAPDGAAAEAAPQPLAMRAVPFAFTSLQAIETGTASAIEPVDDTLYSSADDDVEPPSWREIPASPPQLAGSAEEVPPIELIIAADGSVERARLVFSARRLPDMMILSGAKTWRFDPALRQGRPVRYRYIVRLSEVPGSW